MPHDLLTLCLIAMTFLLAGLVKGVIGLGLPTVSLALLSMVLNLPAAMALMLVPSFATNLWQALQGGHLAGLLRRLWPFLLPATLTVAIGARGLQTLPLHLLGGLLGVLLVCYALLGLSGLRWSLHGRRETWLGPLLGALNGVLTGMTGSFVFPGVMYLQATGLTREQLIQAMGILFTLSTLALGLALQERRLLDPELGLLSVAALLPAGAGMVVGRRLRQRLSEPHFRRIFFLALLLVGAHIIVRALVTR
ncbi:MAG: sulfite exporter TauE/SafE family protein [Gammaproteobacteria bacterium]|nr:sulfite exporter TauE/SafE family protein [Gammaproteobacteria bacterium]